jgi:trehalose/maltose hydrolase-like predicted phosphorylase
VLTCSDPGNEEPAYLSNGLIGLRIGRDGAASGPLLVADQYDLEESMLPLPNPVSGSWGFDPSVVKGYRQELDMGTGVLSTRWSEEGHDDVGKQTSVSFECSTVVHPTKRMVAERWRIDIKGIVNLRYTMASSAHLDSSQEGRRRFSGSLASGVRLYTMEQTFTGFKPTFSESSLYPGGPVPRFDEVWNFDASDKLLSFDEVARAAAAAWKQRWRTDIVIDGPVEDQRAIHSWMFYLWSSMNPSAKTAVAPMGLSSETYKGHVFWDADIWVFPALAFIDPTVARTIPDYRISHQPQSGIYPWESGPTGRELAPLAMLNAKHVTGDVAFMLQQAASLGLAQPDRADAIGQIANQAFLKWATPSADGLALKKVRGPDEFHIGDNDLFTNCLAQWLSDRFSGIQGARNLSPNPLSTAGALEEGAQAQNPKSIIQNPKYHLPHDSAGLLSMDDDKVNYYGQADAILAIYPLQNATAEQQANQMMRRFPPQMSDSTPAMTNSIQALIWARLGQTDKAYAEWEKSWRDFSDHPLNLFSEQRRKNRTYFVTGAAGCLQTVLYGFLGFRIDWKKHQGADWTKRLRGENWLTIQPHLPQQWKRVTFRNFALLGQHYTLTVSHNGTTVTEGER